MYKKRKQDSYLKIHRQLNKQNIGSDTILDLEFQLSIHVKRQDNFRQKNPFLTFLSVHTIF